VKLQVADPDRDMVSMQEDNIQNGTHLKDNQSLC